MLSGPVLPINQCSFLYTSSFTWLTLSKIIVRTIINRYARIPSTKDTDGVDELFFYTHIDTHTTNTHTLSPSMLTLKYQNFSSLGDKVYYKLSFKLYILTNFVLTIQTSSPGSRLTWKWVYNTLKIYQKIFVSLKRHETHFWKPNLQDIPEWLSSK